MAESISPEVFEQAAAWFVTTRAGELDEAERQRFQCWLEAHPDHRLAWQKATALASTLDSVPRGVAWRTISRARTRRRSGSRALSVVLLGGLALFAAYVGRPALERSHVLQTRVGERAEYILSDGTSVTLNTASHAVSRYGLLKRTVQLESGEVQVRTAADRAFLHRSFVVQTPFARLTALGTDFDVRLTRDGGTLAVFEGRVRVEPRDGRGAPSVIGAGEKIQFTASEVQGRGAALPDVARAWTRGMLIANDMPLCELVEELGRYRAAPLTCDTAASGLSISGAFPLKDTDAVLQSLTLALPVRVTHDADGSVRILPR